MLIISHNKDFIISHEDRVVNIQGVEL